MNQLSSAPPQYQLITDDLKLAELVERCRQLPWIAIDTEFVRTNTYYPKMGLIQLAADNDFFLIDPLAIDNPQPLADLLTNQQVVKVMHSCSEDLEVFQHYLGQLPTPLFDTQIAAALLGHGLSIGYKTLVEELYQVSLPKGEQRSDWLARPLSRAQKEYAIMDVVFLADIYRKQLEPLTQLDRLAWVEEECGNLLLKQRRELPPEQQYRRVKGAGTLTGEQLVVLRSLATWRETEAERRNIPRGFILRDQAMVEAVRIQPDSVESLSKVENIHPRTLRKDGRTIVDIIAEAAKIGGSLEIIDGSLPRHAKTLLKKMQSDVAAKAQAVNVPPELIINRKTLAACILGALATGELKLPDELSQWKRALVEKSLLQLMSEFTEAN